MKPRYTPEILDECDNTNKDCTLLYAILEFCTYAQVKLTAIYCKSIVHTYMYCLQIPCIPASLEAPTRQEDWNTCKERKTHQTHSVPCSTVVTTDDPEISYKCILIMCLCNMYGEIYNL